MRHIILGILFITCSYIAACSSEEFGGCYTTTKEEAAVFMVTKESGHYAVSLRESGRWASGAQLHTATQKELAEMFGKDAPLISQGLIANDEPFGLFKAKSGAKFEPKDPSSDYIGFLFVGGGPAFKVQCP